MTNLTSADFFGPITRFPDPDGIHQKRRLISIRERMRKVSLLEELRKRETSDGSGTQISPRLFGVWRSPTCGQNARGIR